MPKNAVKLNFPKDGLSKYDVCIVFPSDASRNGQFMTEGLEVVSKVIAMFHRDNIFMFKSVMKDEIYVLIHITLPKLKQFADNFDLTFIADPVAF